MKLLILFLLLIFLIMASAFFSGCETGIYRLSRLRVRLGAEKGQPLYRMLRKIIREGQGVIFSILIGNNLATYFATILATVILIDYTASKDMSEYYATLIMAPLLFVFGEVIPKTIYYHKADHIMPRFAPVLLFIHSFFSYTGLVYFLKHISQGLTSILKIHDYEQDSSTAIVRQHIEGILQDTSNEGYLSHIQTDIVKRVMNVFDVKITSVMVPINRVAAVNVNSTKDELMATLEKVSYTRLLVYENEHDNIIGYINIYEAINDNTGRVLRELVRPIYRFIPNTPIMRALHKMHSDPNIKIALIARARKRHRFEPLGIVTLKDLAEEITGELAVC